MKKLVYHILESGNPRVSRKDPLLDGAYHYWLVHGLISSY